MTLLVLNSKRNKDIINMSKSFYLLEISVQPGAARESKIFVLNNFQEIKYALEKSLSLHLDIYLTVLYKRRICLTVYQKGKISQKINLLPYIRIKIENYPDVWFDDEGNLQGIVLTDELGEKSFVGHADVDKNKLLNELLDGDIKFSSTISWDDISIQPLTDDKAQPEDTLTFQSRCGLGEETYGYGLTEDEMGFYLRNIDWNKDDFGLEESMAIFNKDDD